MNWGKKRDAFGKLLVADALYFIQDWRGVVGNCASFWAKEAAGYVCNLADAGLYRGDCQQGSRDTDVYWPEAFIRATAIQHVRVEPLSAARMVGKPEREADMATTEPKEKP